MPAKKDIIDSIADFCKIEAIQLDTALFVEQKYSPINDYIHNLKSKVKPESAANVFIQKLMVDIFEGTLNPEVNIGGDFIDFIINDKGISNPVCIELKPLFKFNPSKTALIQPAFDYQQHIVQITKYLKKKNVEYVILTNINKAYIFNRSAIIDFKPFKETTLCEILSDYLINLNLWDNIRKYEDDIVSNSLDTEFFNDLKKWFKEFANIKFIEHDYLSREEIVVLFLNKFIFIKTLEDHGLIPYRYIQDNFEYFARQWVAKGNFHIFEHFFKNLEDFFEIHYDTELFNSNFWNYLEKEDANLDLFRQVFELIIGLDTWSVSFGKGLVHYNYRQINEDIFGKAYETWIAENRKDEGIYYTPADITEYMAELIVDAEMNDVVDELLSELKKPDIYATRVYGLTSKLQDTRFIDSTSGSGSFLIKVLRRVYYQYKRIEEGTNWASNIQTEGLFGMPSNIKAVVDYRAFMNFNIGSELIFISSIILNHIFAADKDERAIDTAKTNIWKEAVKLNPQIYNYRKLDNKKIHILPNLEMNFIKGDSLTDFDFNEQIEIIYSEFKEEIIKLFKIRKSYLADVYNPELLRKVYGIKNEIRKRLKEHNEFEDSLFYPLEFFFCFFNEEGEPLPEEERGFNGIISNPPWEVIKPVRKEFAKFGKYELDAKNFEEVFDKLITEDKILGENWKKYTQFYYSYRVFLRNKYNHQGKGDLNYFKVFMERDFQLIRKNAAYCLLVPSSFQTDEGTNSLRKLLIEIYHLKELTSFENKGYQKEDEKYKTKLFPEVHPQFKFSIVFAKKENLNGFKHKFKAKFYLHDPKDLRNGNPIFYDIEKIKEFSPENLSIMEFKSDTDYLLCSKIIDNHAPFKNIYPVFKREFHMTDDAHLFMNLKELKNKKSSEYITLYKGEMIHQFNSSYQKHLLFVEKEAVEKRLNRVAISRISRELTLTKADVELMFVNKEIPVEYKFYRLAYRAIGSSTNERTLISTIIPKNVASVNSLNQLIALKYKYENGEITYDRLPYTELIYLMSLFNSLTLNYYLRNKISANLNMFYIYELPLASATEEEKKRITELGFSLLYRKSNKADFEELKNELNIDVDESEVLLEVRAKLEIIIARDLYKLSRDDWDYLTSTFIYGSESDTKAELDEIIRYSKDMW